MTEVEIRLRALELAQAVEPQSERYDHNTLVEVQAPTTETVLARAAAYVGFITSGASGSGEESTP